MEINKIIQGDCLEVMKTFPDESIDMILTSPPYDNLREYKGYNFNFKGIAKELYRIIKQGRIIVWVVADQTNKFCESLSSFKQAIYFVEECGFNLLDTMIYHKTTVPPAYPSLKRYGNCFEYMFIFSKGKPNTFNAIQKEKIHGIKEYKSTYRQRDGSLKSRHIKGVKNTKKKITNMWSYGSGGKSEFNHPAKFPEKLAEDHILSWSNEQDIVLDPMMGSGTTLAMAKKNNRNYIGIEISKEYVKIAEARISATIVDNKIL
jgi:site-specific DNA-methyltransferase (adenine-specific)